MNHNIQNSSPDGWCRCEKKEDKLEHIQQRGVGLMDHWQGRPLRQHDLALHLLLAPRLILRGKAAGQQRIANLTVSRRVTDILHFGVQGQHPAAVAAAVATPYVLGQVDTQFPPLTAAQGAVSIDIAGTPPPDMQAEEFDYIYDGKGKIRRPGCHRVRTPFHHSLITVLVRGSVIRPSSLPTRRAAVRRRPLTHSPHPLRNRDRTADWMRGGP